MSQNFAIAAMSKTASKRTTSCERTSLKGAALPKAYKVARKSVSKAKDPETIYAKKRTLNVIDLFSGCGGLTLGFLWDRLFSAAEENPICKVEEGLRPSPFRSVLANDFNREAINTYRSNFDPKGLHSIYGPIEEILDSGKAIPKADVVMGGPPCQGFSLLNKNREGDVRRALWWRFMEVAERSEAGVIVMENVPQLLDGDEYEQIKNRLRELGFMHMMAGVLCAANYGVAQTRQRAIIMASRVGPISLPIPTHLPQEKIERLNGLSSEFEDIGEWVPVRRVFAGLPRPKGVELRNESDTLRLHFGRTPTAVSMERYRAVPPGGNRIDLLMNRPDITPACWVRKKSGGTDLFGRLWWDRPSVTIRTEFYKPEKGRYLHPSEHRPITHREAARIQSFPDSFKFAGNKIEIAKQIGNAVPPVFAYRIALEVERCLKGETTVEDMLKSARVMSKMPKSKLKGLWNGSTK